MSPRFGLCCAMARLAKSASSYIRETRSSTVDNHGEMAKITWGGTLPTISCFDRAPVDVVAPAARLVRPDRLAGGVGRRDPEDRGLNSPLLPGHEVTAHVQCLCPTCVLRHGPLHKCDV
jgi:hypothetical protein